MCKQKQVLCSAVVLLDNRFISIATRVSLLSEEHATNANAANVKLHVDTQLAKARPTMSCIRLVIIVIIASLIVAVYMFVVVVLLVVLTFKERR